MAGDSLNVVIMGCGRVGSDLTVELARAGHHVSVIDKRAAAFDRLPPGFEAQQTVGLGFDRSVLESAGVMDADAFLAVSSGDNSNIVSARVAKEYYNIPHVIARINDPRRADIYERFAIPTVAPVRTAVKQIMLLMFHPREEIRESMASGDLLRMRVEVPGHFLGKPVETFGESGRIQVIGVERGGTGFIPMAESTFQEGDVAQVIIHRDAIEALDALMTFSGEH